MVAWEVHNCAGRLWLQGKLWLQGRAMVAWRGNIMGGEIWLHRRTVVAAENIDVRKKYVLEERHGCVGGL